jgi:hypothetical protein
MHGTRSFPVHLALVFRYDGGRDAGLVSGQWNKWALQSIVVVAIGIFTGVIEMARTIRVLPKPARS